MNMEEMNKNVATQVAVNPEKVETIKEEKLNDDQFIFEGEVVTLFRVTNNKNEFKFRDVTSDTIEKLTPELYQKINAAVEIFKAQRDEIIKKRGEERLKQIVIEKAKEVEEFKKWFAENAPSLMSQNPEFREGLSNFYDNAKVVKFKVEPNFGIELSFQRGGGGYYYSGDKWQVEDNEYHRRYYTKFTSAVRRVAELIKEYRKRAIQQAKNKEVADLETQALQNFADAVGLKLGQEYHSGHQWGRRGYLTYNLKPADDSFELGLKVSSENKISVTSVKISKVMIFLRKVSDIQFILETPITMVEEAKTLIQDIRESIPKRG